MTSSFRFGRFPRSFRSVSNKRRPAGVSRRRKKQLGFETLEDRRVMSAQSPLANLQGQVDQSLGIQVSSLSSGTAEGLLAILQNELFWQSQQTSGSNVTRATSRSIPTDPLLANQWHLINTGQQVGNPDFQTIFGVPGEDINVAPVWNQGIFGNGVVVGVFEAGGVFETSHPDLAANVDPILTFSVPGVLETAHATAVAGLIGAAADNGIGGTGVAPGVVLVPMGPVGSPDFNAAAFRFAAFNDIDIVNNSWGPPDDVRSLGPVSAEEIEALRDSVFFGRDNLGVINVWAAGNGAGADFDQGFADLGVWDTAAYDGYVSSRYTIGVTGVDHDGFYNNVDGTVTSYPEVSTGVLIAAPTGSVFSNIADDQGIGSGIVTTDLTGDAGFNSTGFVNDRDFLEDTDFVSRFNGTSASAPIASGVIALMLEANPNLTWRDVQEILVRSARQNAEFDVPSTVGLGSTQNTWINNQMPVFHDPDVFNPAIDPFLQTFFPTLDPTLSSGFNGLHFQPTPQVLTNSAGFTVSQGVSPASENIGYAHGVVDAELAVQLAQQWHTKNQALPNELTFTTFVSPTEGPDINIPAAEIGNEDSGFQFVPGGIGGTVGGGFIDYWNEFFVDDPFVDFDDDDRRGGFLEFSVPDINAMAVESIDVRLSISGTNPEFMNHARVLLVSPEGTHSELNQFWVEADPGDTFILSNTSPATIFGNDQGSVDPDTGNFVWTFTANRNWGERSDDAIIFDPTTNEPAGGTQGWRLFIENYSDTNAFAIAGLEVAWHGSQIGANTQRIQGLIGVDDGVNGIGARDDSFNFSRVFLNNFDVDGVVRFGEVTNTIDTLHESMAANATVTIRRASDDVVVDQFVTGADGNYYFDVVPDNYIISIEDSLGRVALDDTLTPAGFLKDYQSEWLVTTDFFKVWDYDANLEVPLQVATNAPFSFSGTAIPDNVKHINFLLDPGPPAAPQVDFSGTVFADINGDGLFNADDVAVPGVGVFGDVNRNGALDAGEVLTTTDANGDYLLTVPGIFATSVLNVGVRPPANWTASNPDAGFKAFFVQPGDAFTGVDFHITPPSESTPGDGSALSGIVLGTVFNDKNGDMNRQSDEFGVPNVTVYIDMNNSNAIDAGDIVTATNVNGAYAFANVPDGSHFLRIVLDPDSGISQTFPDFDLPQVAAIVSGGTATNVLFGISSGSGGGSEGVLDFGDLPDVYGTTLAANGARHPEGIFFLGAMIDSEANGIPTSDALGDDLNFLADEDGVVLVGSELVPSSTGTLTVTASRHGGYLQGWIDYNNDGDFGDIIDGVSEQIVVNNLLDPGVNAVTFDIPATLGASTVYARFRYGEFGLGSTGLAQVGEVEDYAFNVNTPAPPVVLIHGPDFNEDGQVSGFDFLAWQLGFGTTPNATAQDGDSNSDGAVDNADLVDWEADFGASSSTAAATAQTGDFDQDGQVDGNDFLAWQVGAGLQSGAALSDGDGNLDGDVNADDLGLWEDSYGADATGSNAPLAAAVSSGVSSRSAPTTSSLSESTAFTPASSRAVVNSTPASAERPDGNTLAFVASEVQRRFRLAHSFDRHDEDFHQRARIETQTTETSFGDSIDLIDLGSVMRDRAVDRLFGQRDRLFDQLPFHHDHEDHLAEDALETVLGEEIEWRFA